MELHLQQHIKVIILQTRYYFIIVRRDYDDWAAKIRVEGGTTLEKIHHWKSVTDGSNEQKNNIERSLKGIYDVNGVGKERE